MGRSWTCGGGGGQQRKGAEWESLKSLGNSLHLEVVCVYSLQVFLQGIWDAERESWKGQLSGLYVLTRDLGFYLVFYGHLLGDFEQGK